jgi:hypothetical protein
MGTAEIFYTFSLPVLVELEYEYMTLPTKNWLFFCPEPMGIVEIF